MKELRKIYSFIKNDILIREKEFSQNWEKGDSAIFPLLLFSLCTPQSSATRSWNALNEFLPNLYELSEQQIGNILGKYGVRFKNNKSRHIVSARERFANQSIKEYILGLISIHGVIEARNILASSIKGIGMKEASHFLRNIGWGQKLCILDRHILRNLEKYKVLKAEPLTFKRYLEYEKRMLNFSQEIKIPVLRLDFVFWYNNNKELQIY